MEIIALIIGTYSIQTVYISVNTIDLSHKTAVVKL